MNFDPMAEVFLPGKHGLVRIGFNMFSQNVKVMTIAERSSKDTPTMHHDFDKKFQYATIRTGEAASADQQFKAVVTGLLVLSEVLKRDDKEQVSYRKLPEIDRIHATAAAAALKQQYTVLKQELAADRQDDACTVKELVPQTATQTIPLLTA